MSDAPKKIPFTLINREMMPTIRTLLIDAGQRAITEVKIELTGDKECDDKRFAELLHCNATEVAVCSWVDDTEIDGKPVGDLVLAVDGRTPDADPHGWFQLDDQEPLEGYGIVCGLLLRPDNATAPKCDIEELRRRVTFTTRRFVYGPVDANGVMSRDEAIIEH